jgi:hypothetical protein
MFKIRQISRYYSQCICMVKKIKKKNKNYSKNNVILSLWSRSVDIYDFRVDKLLFKKVSCDRLFCHLVQYFSLPMRARYKILEKLIFFRYIYKI